MSPLSWPVVAGTVLVASPALWAAQVTGTLSTDVAVVRLLLCAIGVWAVCSGVVALTDRVVAANEAVAPEEPPEMQRPAGVDS